MSYIFGKIWHSAIIWPIGKSFQCVLQGVRFLMANHTQISPTSDNDSYISMLICLRKMIMTLTTNQGRWFRSTDYCCLRGWTEQRLDGDFRVDSFTGGGRFIGFDGHRNQNQGFGQQQTAAIPSETTTSIGPAKNTLSTITKENISSRLWWFLTWYCTRHQ